MKKCNIPGDAEICGMDHINLPLDLLPGNKMPESGLVIHPYETGSGSVKGRSVLHTHAISLVMSGTKTMHFPGHTVQADADHFHFLAAGKCLASMDIPRHTRFRSILLFFDDTCLNRFMLKYHHLAGRLSEQEGHEPSAYFSLKKDSYVKQYIDGLSNLLESSNGMSAEMQAIKWEEFMLYLMQYYTQALLSFQQAVKGRSPELEFRRVVETNIGNDLTLDELAFLCNCSLATFKRKFQKVYGSSPGKWIMRQRLQMAARLLHSAHNRPSEIYHRVGYENHSSFSQSFKAFYGQTPTEYQSAILSR